MTRGRLEAGIALVCVVAVLIVGAATIGFVYTINPVHSGTAAVRGTAAAIPPGAAAAAIDRARQMIRAQMVADNLPGLSVAVARDGHVVWAEGFGWADVERRTPVTPTTEFRLGSASKALTAAAVGLLHDRGAIELDAPVQRYVRAYPEKPWPMRVRDVMADVAGVHHLRGNSERMPGRHCVDLTEAVDVFAGDPLLFPPETQYRYSIYGWVLASAAIESASGTSFATAMRRDLLGPLGMDHTILDADSQARDRVSYYFPRMATRTTLGLQDAPAADYSCLAGAGAYLSTPSDLARFGVAMLTPGWLNAATLRLIESPTTLASGVSTGFGWGWKIAAATLNGVPTRLLSHTGTPSGGTASLLLVPDRSLAVIVLTNVSYAKNVPALSQAVAEIFAERPSSGVTPKER